MKTNNSVVVCPNCATQIVAYTNQDAKYFTCKSCRTFFSAYPTITLGNFVKDIPQQTIKKGDQCIIDSIKYTVIGVTVAKDSDSGSYWDEYFLFADSNKYLFLTCYNGHWNIVKPIYDYNTNQRVNVIYRSLDYKMFNKYRMYYVSAFGEFAHNLIPSTEKVVIEYIHPPFSIIKEFVNDEVQCFLAKYIEPTEVESYFKFFQTPVKVSSKSNEIYYNQPNKYNSLNWLYKDTAIFAVIILIVSGILSVFQPSNKVYQQTVFMESLSNNLFVSEDIKLNSYFGSSCVELEIYAEVDNSWLEAEVNLINQNTDEEFSSEIGVEYYHGYESGSSWAEGSYNSSKLVSKVPNGTYKIAIHPTLDYSASNKINHFVIKVYERIFMPSNFFLTILVIALIPLYCYISYLRFEASRWENTTYDKN